MLWCNLTPSRLSSAYNQLHPEVKKIKSSRYRIYHIHINTVTMLSITTLSSIALPIHYYPALVTICIAFTTQLQCISLLSKRCIYRLFLAVLYIYSAAANLLNGHQSQYWDWALHWQPLWRSSIWRFGGILDQVWRDRSREVSALLYCWLDVS